jgi:hypothetical protein
MQAPQRIRRLIEGDQLEQITPDPEKVVALWRKALASSRDSRRGLSNDNAVTLGYQAALQAASAVLEAAGYRTRGQTGGHHFNTFYALAALQYPGLEEVDIRAEKIRKMRKLSFYDAAEATPEQASAVHEWLNELLPAVRGALIAAVPDLASRLPET